MAPGDASDEILDAIERFASRTLRTLRRERTRARTLLGRARLELVHDPRYRMPPSPVSDPERATKILDYLSARGWASTRNVAAPPPLALIDLVRVHDPAYLESLDSPEVLGRIFGEEATRGHAAECLLAERWATAGTVHAAELALRGSRKERKRARRAGAPRAVVNLGGGFHHAHPDRGAGFCAFNDIAAAIARIRGRGFDGRILVVDLDLHHGDGTRAFFRADERVFTYSMHAATWDAGPAIAALDVELGPAVGDDTYLAALRRTLPEFFSRAAPELVFYVAGVDIADGDRLGSYRVSADGVLARDRFVFELAGGLPVVMLLAGGYGPDAWRYTARTLLWLLSGEDVSIPTGAEAALMKFRAIRTRLGSQRLSASPLEDDRNFGITEADIMGDLVRKSADPKLLGFYTAFGLEVAFERYGLAEHLRKRGYPQYEISLDAIGTSGRGFRVYADPSRRDVLIEIVLAPFYGVTPFRLLSIEWLLLQDPRRPVGPADRLLPGQRFHGLGALDIVAGMLVMTCERLGFDGLTLVPAHFHVAARAQPLLTFLEPADEARYLALAEATRGLELADASRRIARGDATDRATGRVVTHEPARMVLPVSDALKTRLRSAEYARGVEEAARALDLRLVDRPMPPA